MIVTRQLRPGSMISENQLSEQLGCGRTPIREALQRLKFEGFVEIHARRGVLVAPIDVVKQLELLEVRRPLGTPRRAAGGGARPRPRARRDAAPGQGDPRRCRRDRRGPLPARDPLDPRGRAPRRAQLGPRQQHRRDPQPVPPVLVCLHEDAGGFPENSEIHAATLSRSSPAMPMRPLAAPTC